MRRRFFSRFLLLAALALLSGSALAQQKFVAHLDPTQEVPATASNGFGWCVVTLDAAETSISVSCTYQGLTSALQLDHIHGNAAPGSNAAILFNFNQTGGTSGSFTAGPFSVTAAQVADMRAHLWYINLHSVNFPGGEIRGQVKQATTVSDYDGDGRSDITVFRQSNNRFYILRSLTNTIEADVFGSGSGDSFLNGTSDFDGDGRTDALLFKSSINNLWWSILQSSTNTVRSVPWGVISVPTLDIMVPADYDGDGKQDIAVYRFSTGVWYIIQSSDGAQRVESWGFSTGLFATSDLPCVGDYDGDGKADLTVGRAVGSNRVFYIRQSATDTLRAVAWGNNADGFYSATPIDVDGDGKQDLMTVRLIGNQTVYFVQRSSDGQTYYLTWGDSGVDTEQLFGDYDGDGKTDFVARVENSSGIKTWYIFQSSTQTSRAINFGRTNDQ